MKYDDIYFHIVIIESLCAANATWSREGVTVAGSASGIPSLTPTGLRGPNDMLIDSMGHLFIADSENNRVVCWLNNATQGYVVAGTGAFGSWINLLKYPGALVGK